MKDPGITAVMGLGLKNFDEQNSIQEENELSLPIGSKNLRLNL